MAFTNSLRDYRVLIVVRFCLLARILFDGCKSRKQATCLVNYLLGKKHRA